MAADPTRRRHDTDTEIPARLVHEMDNDKLSQLVRAVNAEGVSYQAMADRSAAAGWPVSKPYFQKMASNAVVTGPSPERIEGIRRTTGRPAGCT